MGDLPYLPILQTNHYILFSMKKFNKFSMLLTGAVLMSIHSYAQPWLKQSIVTSETEKQEDEIGRAHV